MDDPIRKDHDWEFFDRLSPRKRRNKLKKMNKNLTDLGLISMRQGIEHKISQG